MCPTTTCLPAASSSPLAAYARACVPPCSRGRSSTTSTTPPNPSPIWASCTTRGSANVACHRRSITMTTPEKTARLPWDAADPFPYYESRRREGGVVWDDGVGAWLILGYHAAQQILASADWTSNPMSNPTAPVAVRAMDPDML